MKKIIDAVGKVRVSLRDLYYSIPKPPRPEPKVIAGAIGAPIGAAIGWAAGHLALPLDAAAAATAGAAIGSFLVGWVVSGETEPERNIK